MTVRIDGDDRTYLVSTSEAGEPVVTVDRPGGVSWILRRGLWYLDGGQVLLPVFEVSDVVRLSRIVKEAGWKN